MVHFANAEGAEEPKKGRPASERRRPSLCGACRVRLEPHPTRTTLKKPEGTGTAAEEAI